MKTIEIPMTYEDLEDLQNGKEFDWEFDGIKIHIFNEEY